MNDPQEQPMISYDINLHRKYFVGIYNSLSLKDKEITLNAIRGQLDSKIPFVSITYDNGAILGIRHEIAHEIASLDWFPALGGSTSPESRRFIKAAKFIDLILEPEAAESAIGDLAEGFQRRAPLDRSHATRWLWAQVARLTFHRVLDLVRNVVRARAGK